MDDLEFFAGKAVGLDVPISVIPPSPNVNKQPIQPFLVEDMFTVLGWYERPRLAGVFSSEARDLLAGRMREARLRQDISGNWRLSEVDSFVHRISHPATRRWTLVSKEARSLAMRVEALYAIETNKVAAKVATPESPFEVSAAKGVAAKGEKASDSVRGAVYRLSAENSSAERNASWARAAPDFPRPYFKSPCSQFGMWVKGDGSGALLDVEFLVGREYFGSMSMHHVRLDFTGWQFITLVSRERDSADHVDYVWPYPKYSYAVFRNPFNCSAIAGVHVYLNDIPKGSRTEVEFGEICAYRRSQPTYHRPALELNGELVRLPFDLSAGEFAECEDGAWIRYSEKGDPLCKMPATIPSLRNGENVLSYTDGGDGTLRAEVTLFGLGRSIPAYVSPLPVQVRDKISYEAARPVFWAPSKGFSQLPQIPVRPGERAMLDVTLVGPVADPVLTIRTSGKTVDLRFRTLKANERQRIASGPLISEACSLSMSSSDPLAASARISIVKRYAGRP